MENNDYSEVEFTSTYGLEEPEVAIKAPLVPVPPPNTTLKNIERLNSIRCLMCATAKLTLYTPIARRHLRRDFNIATAKMYVYGLNKAYKAEIVEALSDLEFAIELLEMDVALWSEQRNPLTPCVFEVLLISPQSVRMMRTLTRLDKCMLGVYSAYLSGLLTRPQKNEVLRPFHIAYLNFKRVAMKLEMNQSANEMVESMEREVRFT